MAPTFNLLIHYGPLSRNKSIPLDSQPSVSSTNFEFDRFKRHMTSVLERLCRITSDMKHHHSNHQQQQQSQQLNLAPFTTNVNISKNKDAIVRTEAMISSFEEESLNKNNMMTAMIKNKTMESTSSALEMTESEKIENNIISEFKGHLKTTFNNDNDEHDENRLLNENDWLNTSNEIPTSVEVMLGQDIITNSNSGINYGNF